MPRNFTGTLNVNEFYNGLYNAYRLIQTIADGRNFDDSLANLFRVDGGMYADKAVYTDMDVLMSKEWDPTDTNVLAPEMVVAPKQQEIVINKKRQIGLYTEAYLSKRAWMDPSVFDQFRSVVQAQVSNTKKLHEQRLVDVYVGTTRATGAAAASGSQNRTVNINAAVGSATGEEKNRITAQAVAKSLADLFVDMADSTRSYTDNAFMKAFSKDNFKVIWNAEWYNQILYIDLPTVYHKDELIKQGRSLPARYFGDKLTTLPSNSAADGTTHRAAAEYKIRVNASGAYAANGTTIVNVFPGDLLPSGTPLVLSGTALTTASGNFVINGKNMTVTYYSTCHAYVADPSIICKVLHDESVKFLSSFETETEFWNPKNLSTNRYLTWMYADPEYLAAYPFVTVSAI